MHVGLKGMCRAASVGLVVGASLTASAVTVDVVSGYAERRQVGDFELLFVKSNSMLRVSGEAGTVDVLAVGGGGGGGACRAKARASGGIGGGGSGSQGESTTEQGMGENGVDFTGGGGGGARSVAAGNGSRGGRGGSGLVVVRYRLDVQTEPTIHEEGVATGGDIYRRRRGFGVHTFTNDGTFVLSEPATVDMLLVGGGGGGGAWRGGGGGAGGVFVLTNFLLSAGSYAVTVGAGGAGGARGNQSNAGMARNGDDSSFAILDAFSIVVKGGGAGGTGGARTDGSQVGKVGGSGGGGGGGYFETGSHAHAGGSGTTYQGYGGGASTNIMDHYRSFGGGGGGAGSPGQDAEFIGGSGASYHGAGMGGDGLWCDFSGSRVCYGGGGGGGNSGRPNAGVGAVGGAGGGGAG